MDIREIESLVKKAADEYTNTGEIKIGVVKSVNSELNITFKKF